MRWNLFYIMLSLILLFPSILRSQEEETGYYFIPIKIENGDTVPIFELQEVYIYPKLKFNNQRDFRRYGKLVKNIKKVYPFAILLKQKLDEVNDQYLALQTEKEKKQFIKEFEKSIREEYEDDIRSLTITQGRILLKLIDRETGNTSYELLKEFRGSFSAFFWQTVARIFGTNLKSEYDPEGEDKLMEQIVLRIEAGQI